MKQKLKPFVILVIPVVVVLLAFSLPFNSNKEEESSGSSSETSNGILERETFVFSPFSHNKLIEQEGVSDEVVEETSLDKIYPDLPIYIADNETSVGIITTINIYRTVMDPWDEITLEIYGIEYKRAAIDIKDPNMIAFQETFLMAKDLLSAKGINLSELNISYGNVPYVSRIAEFWVENLHLL